MSAINGRMMNLSKDEYEQETERMRGTWLKKFLSPQGPRNFYYSVLNPIGEQKEQEHFTLGRLAHEFIIEGRQGWVESEVRRDLQNESYQMVLANAGWQLEFDDGEVYKSGPRKGKHRQIARVAKKGKDILKKHQGNLIRSWRDAAMRNREVREIIEGPRFSEQVIFWDEVVKLDDGSEVVVPCRCAIDLWSAPKIGCLKTTTADSPDKYRWECHKHLYPLSAAFQMRGRDAVPEIKERCGYFHIVIFKDAPFWTYVWPLHGAWIRSQRFVIEKCLKTYAECRQREAAGMDPLEAWPDPVEREEGVLVQQPQMWAEQGRSVGDYDPSP